ncbi:cyclic nucleotide-gated ion channel 1-like [Humulus lupulus]|uniref:cyclic nucleotide-gated ion channel 1-like n=1 Tax=Humulus lupulus TaxID=3486 RepID=UPI002B40095D|nr:cyclic nucleotide-gated ion channel 1-like [Humulus lupulus]
MEDKKEAKIEMCMAEPDWSIQHTIGASMRMNSGIDQKKKKKGWTKIKEILMQKSWFLPMWNKIFLLVCVIAVTLDPLFFYIPIIDKDKKCIKTDKKLRNSALILRSLMDIIYIIDISCIVAKTYKSLEKDQIVKSVSAVAKKISWSLIFVDFLAILPVPQVIILAFDEGNETSASSSKKLINTLLLFQYLPRVFRIYLSCKELAQNQDSVTRIVWVKGGLNFFLYILASHVFGSFWYFYSFQRQTSCWHSACKTHGEKELCEKFEINKICNNGTSKFEQRNMTNLITKYCPINPGNATIFDFGIFLEALESGVLESMDFPQKLMKCFWWGLRNLSSAGQNLETSSYFWENFFVVSISIIGLLLFLYLIGNLQTYLQLSTTKSEELGEKMRLKEQEIEFWIEKNGLPKEEKALIMQKVKHKLKENREVDVENLLSILPSEDRKRIKHLLCFPLLQKVPMLENMEREILDMICENLKPVIYTESSYMIREGDPLDRVIFITHGTAWAYTNNASDHNEALNVSSSTRNSRTRRLKKCDFFGEELLEWSRTQSHIIHFPIATINVKSHTKVEAFSLMANDLLNIVKKNYRFFRRNIPTNQQRQETSVQLDNDDDVKSQSSNYQHFHK